MQTEYKKNYTMRLAMVLLIAVILTTCMVSGTFSKYSSAATGDDNARVTEWGVTINAHGTTFADSYDTDDGTISTITKSVVSNDGKKVVAPGTSGSLANATISGTPETAVEVSYDPTLTVSGWKDANGNEYFPIVFTINSETYGMNGIKDNSGAAVDHSYATLAELKNGVESAIRAYSNTYPANTDLSKINDGDTNGYVSLSWEWAFEQNDDVKDTFLGDESAKGNPSKITLSMQTSVTQID